MKFNFNDAPGNLWYTRTYFDHSEDFAGTVVELHKPVLGFVQADKNSNQWYLVTFKTSIIPSPFDNTYVKDGIEYEIVMVHSTSTDEYEDVENFKIYFEGDFKYIFDIIVQQIKNIDKKGDEGKDLFFQTYRGHILDSCPHILL